MTSGHRALRKGAEIRPPPEKHQQAHDDVVPHRPHRDVGRQDSAMTTHAPKRHSASAWAGFATRAIAATSNPQIQVLIRDASVCGQIHAEMKSQAPSTTLTVRAVLLVRLSTGRCSTAVMTISSVPAENPSPMRMHRAASTGNVYRIQLHAQCRRTVARPGLRRPAVQGSGVRACNGSGATVNHLVASVSRGPAMQHSAPGRVLALLTFRTGRALSASDAGAPGAPDPMRRPNVGGPRRDSSSSAAFGRWLYTVLYAEELRTSAAGSGGRSVPDVPGLWDGSRPGWAVAFRGRRTSPATSECGVVARLACDEVLVPFSCKPPTLGGRRTPQST